MIFIRLIIIVLIASYGLTANGQIQKGYVKTKGRMVNGKHIPGQGLPGSTVKIQGVNSIGVRNTNGSFSFIVSERNYIVESVQKKGYELVDVDATKKLYQQSANPIYLVMETPEQQRSDILAAERKIRRNLQRQLQEREDEIEDLQVSQQQKDSLLRTLYKLQGNNEKLISDMAKRYSTLDYDQLDEFYRQVSWFIENGELTRADSLLRTRGDIKEQVQDILKQGQAIQEHKEQIRKAETVHQADIDEAAKRCYSYYEAFVAQNQNDSAAYYLELRASLDTTNIIWKLEAGEYIDNYCRLSNYYDKVEKYYRDAFRLAIDKYGNDSPITGLCYMYMGDVEDLGKFLKEDSLVYYPIALQMLSKHFGEESLEVAKCLRKLYVVYNCQYSFITRLNRYLDKAEECATKAYGIYTKLYGKESAEAAVCYAEIGDTKYFLEDCVPYYEKALSVLHKIGGHPIQEATIYKHMADCYVLDVELQQSILDQARLMYEGLLENKETDSCDNYTFTDFSPKDWDNLMTLHEMLVAQPEWKLEQYTIALSYYQKVKEILSSVYGDKYSMIIEIDYDIEDIETRMEYEQESMNEAQKQLEITKRKRKKNQTNQ